MKDRYDLARFLRAQEGVMDTVRAELRRGRKSGHWMWFVFPQVQGLGHSVTAHRFAIRSLQEAAAYLAHPVLGERLRECCALLLGHAGERPQALLGGIDALKLRSSMTLFLSASGESLFQSVLDTFYHGEPDPATLAILASLPAGQSGDRPDA